MSSRREVLFRILSSITKEDVNWNKKSHIKMLKMALFHCAINEKMLQCWRRTPEDLTAQESPPPGTLELSNLPDIFSFEPTNYESFYTPSDTFAYRSSHNNSCITRKSRSTGARGPSRRRPRERGCAKPLALHAKCSVRLAWLPRRLLFRL